MQCFVFLETSAFEACSGYIDPHLSFLFKTKSQSDHILKYITCIPLITPIFCIKVGFNGTKLHMLKESSNAYSKQFTTKALLC